MTKLFSAIWRFFCALLGKRPAGVPDEVPTMGEPAVMKRARQDLGQEEIPGPAANPVIMAWWRYVDYDPPNGDETPNCAAAMAAWHEESGHRSPRAPNARAWMNWGKAVDKPKIGDVVVEWRDTIDGWAGHVTLYAGPGSTPGTYMALGANQGDKVCIQERTRAKVLGYRRAFSPAGSRTMKASTAQMALLGLDGAVILESQGELSTIGQILGQFGATVPQFLVASFILKILLVCLVIYARTDDAAKKGV
jgi:uncharacterized protein (TIGR02594 family)